MGMAFFLTKFRVLAVDENGYACGQKKKSMYLLVVDENECNIFPHEG